MSPRISVVLIAMMSGFTASAFAVDAQPIDCSGENLTYIGPEVQEFLIPDAPGTSLHVRVQGADGGDAEAGGNNQCKSAGGKGAVAEADFVIGTGAGQIKPGGYLRFIIGEAGDNSDNNNGNGSTSTSGSSGSGTNAGAC